MIEKVIEDRNTVVYYREFKNILEFYKYISERKTNDYYNGMKLLSMEKSKYRTEFTGTKSFEEAIHLLKNGWDDMSKEIEEKLGEVKYPVNLKRRNVYDVVGYQASVPRYLQGVPTNMIMSKNVPCKQKIITVNKMISYQMGVDKKEIIKESVKILSVIKKIEQSGVRCKINILIGGYDECKKNHYELVKVCIKEPSERMNISKMSFLIAHPSVLRRLYLRYIEVSDSVKERFIGYGHVVNADMEEVRNACKCEYLFSPFVKGDSESILKNLKNFYIRG